LNKPRDNSILSALPQSEYQRISDRLEPVQFSVGQVLTESNQNVESLYFVTQGLVSLVSIMQDGSTTEIGLIGKQGVVGIPQFLGNGIFHSCSLVQVEGSAMRIDTEILKEEFNRGESLQKLLLQYNLKLFNQISQIAACNNHHTVKQRTARWLLMLDDRIDRESLAMTQQLLAQMLGVRRTGVTKVANEIKQSGIIDYNRGQITILDRPALEAIACECYQIIKED
jgi:CRP-like cAMP-binding protein